jgi:hypothetical protein
MKFALCAKQEICTILVLMGRWADASIKQDAKFGIKFRGYSKSVCANGAERLLSCAHDRIAFSKKKDKKKRNTVKSRYKITPLTG